MTLQVALYLIAGSIYFSRYARVTRATVALIVFLAALVMGSARHRPAGRAPAGDPEDAAGAHAVGDSPIAGRKPRATLDDRNRDRPRHAA